MTTLFLVPGDDFLYTATILDEDGTAFDLTGATVWFTAKRRRTDADDDAIAKLHWASGGTSAGITVTTPNTGVAAIRLTPSQTDDFSQAAHVWDLQVSDALGRIRTVDSGALVVWPGVTTRLTVP